MLKWLSNTIHTIKLVLNTHHTWIYPTLSIFNGSIKRVWRRVYTVKFVFETWAEVKSKAILKEKFDRVYAPLVVWYGHASVSTFELTFTYNRVNSVIIKNAIILNIIHNNLMIIWWCNFRNTCIISVLIKRTNYPKHHFNILGSMQVRCKAY